MFDGLKEKIQDFTGLGSAGDAEIAELVKEMQRELLQADVDVETVFELTERIKEIAMGELPAGMTRKEHVLKVVYDELVRFLGEEKAEIAMRPQKILLLGLFGAGKTTTAGKLARYFKKRGLSVGLIAADVHRPAAVDQLEQLADRLDVAFYGEKDAEDAAAVVEAAQKEAEEDVLIVDSAGRDSMDAELAAELTAITDIFNPDERFLVVPADIGQNAREQADTFDEAVDLTGVIVTKTDATAKAGGALTSCIAANVPVKFVGTGEKLSALDIYDPVAFVSEMLGVPHLESLLEKAQEAIEEEDVEQMLEGEMNLELFIEQLEKASSSGMFSKLMDQLPVSPNVPTDMLEAQEEQVEQYRHVLNSMTAEERTNPDIINASRIQRIANGAGVEEKVVRTLLKQYKQVDKMMDKMNPQQLQRGDLGKMMQQLGLG